jgi:mRNA-degrading endonuclease RelE of RelBE toxin-antitoxin system
MKYRLTFAPTADRSFQNLPPRVRQAFNRAFDVLGDEPTGDDPRVDVHQLYGYRNVWTLRIPPYRGVYVVDGREVVWIVFGPRESVYATLHGLLPPERRFVSHERARRR